jgi:nitrite reductase (NADH) small subunit
MAEWVRLCAVADAPEAGSVVEAEARGVALCLANVGGRLAVLDNACGHRGGSLGAGWLEGNAVVCPLHCWSFDVLSGEALPPDCGRVAVFEVRVEGADLLVKLG